MQACAALSERKIMQVSCLSLLIQLMFCAVKGLAKQQRYLKPCKTCCHMDGLWETEVEHQYMQKVCV